MALEKHQGTKRIGFVTINGVVFIVATEWIVGLYRKNEHHASDTEMIMNRILSAVPTPTVSVLPNSLRVSTPDRILFIIGSQLNGSDEPARGAPRDPRLNRIRC